MRKDLGKQTYFYPLPVIIIATYNDDGTCNAMNAAWSGIWDYNQIFISLAEHKTTENIRRNKAFTINFADSLHVKEADYVGMVSGNDVPDKVQKAGLRVIPSKLCNAPILADFNLSLECKLNSISDDLKVVGDIVNVSVDESVMINGKIDISKLHIITFDPINNEYVELGKIVGTAFLDGLTIK